MDDLEFNDVFGIGCEVKSGIDTARPKIKCEIDDVKGHKEFFPVSRLSVEGAKANLSNQFGSSPAWLGFNVLGATCRVTKNSNTNEYEIDCEQKREV